MITDNPLSYVIGYIASWAIFIAASLIAFGMLRRLKGKRGDILVNTFFIFVGSMIFALSMEGYYGFFYDQPDSFGTLLTSERWFKRHYRYNNWGFRDDKDYYYKKGKDRYRIVFVGDSFTAGHGIEDIGDRFSGRIEELLRETGSGGYEVYTIAVNGWDTDDEIRRLKKLADEGFEADLVVLCYNMNDIAYASPDTYLFYQELRDKISGSRLLQRSFFLNFLYLRVKVLSMQEVKGYYGWLKGSYSGRAWQDHREQMERFIELCESNGYRLGAVIFPLINDLSRGFGMKDAHLRVAGFFEEKEVPYIDLSERLMRFPEKELAVNRFDSHPNEFAHSLISEDIWEKLIKNILNQN